MVSPSKRAELSDDNRLALTRYPQTLAMENCQDIRTPRRAENAVARSVQASHRIMKAVRKTHEECCGQSKGEEHTLDQALISTPIRQRRTLLLF